MPAFKDSAGREWIVKLDGFVISDVRRELDGLDLADPKSAAQRLMDDPVALVNALWVICRDQANGLKLTDRQFGAALVGDTISDATDALIGAMHDFFPQATRAVLDACVAEAKAVRKMAYEKISTLACSPTLIAKHEKDLDSLISHYMTRSLNTSSSPGLSESTPKA